MTDTSFNTHRDRLFRQGWLTERQRRDEQSLFLESMTSDWARPIVHWAIEAIDPERQRAFYADLFNWEIGDGPFMQVAAGIGGPEPGPPATSNRIDRSYVALYPGRRPAHEIDCAIEHGGTELMAPFDIEGGPTLAAISDPEGNHLMLVQQ